MERTLKLQFCLYFLLVIVGFCIFFTLVGCSGDEVSATTAPVTNTRIPESLGRVGNADDIEAVTSGGTVLMGGGTDVDAAIAWMVEKAGGGDFVVIRATGTNAYNSYINRLGKLNSVETLLINSREKANNSKVEEKIRNAEALFIAGGNQADYVNYWKGTKVEEAIHYLQHVKKCPVGGTSAGNAILPHFYFSALNGTVASAQALANPFHANVTIGAGDFLDTPYLQNTITDTHFNNPNRIGRLLTFLARIVVDHNVVARGIGVEEKTAVCINDDGLASIYGEGNAYFMISMPEKKPEVCEAGKALHWYYNKEAVLGLTVKGVVEGTPSQFNLTTWQIPSEESFYVYSFEGQVGFN